MASTDTRNNTVDALIATGLVKNLSNAQVLKLADAAIGVAQAQPGSGGGFNFGTVIQLLMNNGQEIQDIVNKLGGLGNLLSLAPDIFKIWNASVDTAQKAAARGVDPKQALAAFHTRATQGAGSN